MRYNRAQFSNFFENSFYLPTCHRATLGGKAAKVAKEAKAAALPGGSKGAAVALLVVWLSILPKIYSDGPVLNHR